MPEPRRLVIPTGPLEDPPRGVLVADPTGERNLTKICLAAIKACLAGVDFGEHDEAILEWLAFTCDVGDVATICSIIVRAQTSGLARMAELEARAAEQEHLISIPVDMTVTRAGDRAGDRAADGVTPDGIRSYLSDHGWAQVAMSASTEFWTLDLDGGYMETLFQPDPAAHDYTRRLRMMLNDLAVAEGRSPLLILRDFRRDFRQASNPDSEGHSE